MLCSHRLSPMTRNRRTRRFLTCVATGLALVLGMIGAVMPASAADDLPTVGQPMNFTRCFNSGSEQFPAGAVKTELVVAFPPPASPVVVAEKFSPFPKDPSVCPTPAYPYAYSYAWTPSQTGVAHLKVCFSGKVSAPYCTSDVYLTIYPVGGIPVPATPMPNPVVLPTAPRSIFPQVGSGKVTVYWDAPASNGGEEIGQFMVKAIPGGKSCVTTQLTCTVSGLAHGKSYKFSVTARNSAGVGKAGMSRGVVVK